MGFGGCWCWSRLKVKRYSSEGEDSGLPIPSRQGPLPLEETDLSSNPSSTHFKAWAMSL